MSKTQPEWGKTISEIVLLLSNLYNFLEQMVQLSSDREAKIQLK